MRILLATSDFGTIASGMWTTGNAKMLDSECLSFLTCKIYGLKNYRVQKRKFRFQNYYYYVNFSYKANLIYLVHFHAYFQYVFGIS